MILARALSVAAVVGLDDVDLEREFLEDVVEELDGGLLVVLREDPQHSDAGAVIDRGVLVEPLLTGPGRGSMNLTSICTR